jgi:hypothetical protein
VRRGKPTSFSLSAFSEPHAFLEAVALKYAKDTGAEVSQLMLEVTILDAEPMQTAQVGVYVHGVVSWGMKWDKILKQFVEVKDSDRYPVPWMYLKPCLGLETVPENGFRCPVFIGHREKVLFDAVVATSASPDFWDLQGAALYVDASM